MTALGGKMMITSKHFFVILAATCLVVCFNGMAEVPNNPVADVMVGSSGITWVPKVTYAQMILNLSKPDGTVFCKTFDRGASPYINLGDIMGDSDLEGSFTYELRVVPLLVKISRDEMNREQTRRTREVPLTQTGYFTVREGMIVTPGGIESENVIGISTSQDRLSRTQDQVILDDLIVDGSLCVGFDCINGESFGFDTIRLKENNLRIKFQDTSNSASFPSNDWQITANDSTNGGANKFSIDDIDSGKTPFTIKAGTRANALYVDDSGRVGLGTSTPVEDLHIWYGDTPTIRLDQSGGGWTPQTWDIAGNEANFFIRDVTNGSHLPFRIKPGAPTSTLCLMSDGKVGIGTWSPAYKFEIETTGEDAMFYLDRTDGAQLKVNVTNAQGQIGTQSSHKFNIVTANANRITISSSGNVGIDNMNPGQLFVVGASGTTYCDGTDWYPTSTREAKENIISLTDDEALQALNGLNPVKYNYKQNKEEERVGFIAEDVPELVAINGRKNLNSMDIVAVLTKVVQEQQKSIQEQQKTISELNKRITELEKK
jgi:hypothetical protein